MTPAPLIIRFLDGSRVEREPPFTPGLPIVQNGPPGTAVAFGDGTKVRLPTDQIVEAEDVNGFAEVAFGGMSFEGISGGHLTFHRVRDLRPAHELSPERADRMTLQPTMVSGFGSMVDGSGPPAKSPVAARESIR